MKVLITGGHGFVGKTMVERLNGQKIDIVTPSSKELNLMKKEQVDQYLENNTVDMIVHLAARLGGVGVVMNKQTMFLEDNLLINYNIVKSAIDHNISKFITLGSSCCYGDELPIPLKEEYLWKGIPENTYGVCKLVILEHLKSQNTMNWVYLLPPNIYGPNDHFFEKDAHFIPATIQKIEYAVRNGKNKISVWGDGTQVRDFLYVEDLVDVLIDALNSEIYDRNPVNVATSKGVTVKETVEMLCELMGHQDLDIEWDITKPTGAMTKIMSNEKIKSINPEIRFTTIREGLGEMIAWYNMKKE